MVVRHHSLLDSIISDRGAILTSKFWFSLCYFLGVKRRLSTAFHSQTDGQTEQQNSTMEAYLRAFMSWEQNDLAQLLPIAKFAYNNSKKSVRIIHPLSSIVATTSEFPSKMSAIHAPNPPQPMNWLWN